MINQTKYRNRLLLIKQQQINKVNARTQKNYEEVRQSFWISDISSQEMMKSPTLELVLNRE